MKQELVLRHWDKVYGLKSWMKSLILSKDVVFFCRKKSSHLSVVAAGSSWVTDSSLICIPFHGVILNEMTLIDDLNWRSRLLHSRLSSRTYNCFQWGSSDDSWRLSRIPKGSAAARAVRCLWIPGTWNDVFPTRFLWGKFNAENMLSLVNIVDYKPPTPQWNLTENRLLIAVHFPTWGVPSSNCFTIQWIGSIPFADESKVTTAVNPSLSNLICRWFSSVVILVKTSHCERNVIVVAKSQLNFRSLCRRVSLLVVRVFFVVLHYFRCFRNEMKVFRFIIIRPHLESYNRLSWSTWMIDKLPLRW